ncbi:MAG: ABC transporter ATP-binding protein [Chloroflexi bacterium]|nr:ABC transporter ATP-binding protein [Chloroflexota bacterium]
MKPIDGDYLKNKAEAKPNIKCLIQMKDITKVFHTGGMDFVALNNISIDFYAGEFVSVVGKSGSGKSTLANMITGIDHPTQGSVTIAGIPIHNLKESPMSIWRGKNLGIVFQFYQLLPTLSLLENVMLPMDFCNTYPQSDREPRARDLLDMVGLADFASKIPAAVSGGQQQTAAIARAMANDPPILIADEPTGNLDSKTAEAVFELFSNLVAKGKTVVMVTHDPGLAAKTDRVVHLHDGRLAQN